MGRDEVMKTIIQDLKITVELPEEVLNNLNRAGYLNDYTSYAKDLVIRSYGARSTLNKTIADMIISKWCTDKRTLPAIQPPAPMPQYEHGDPS